VQFHRDAVSRGGGISSSPAGDAYKALHWEQSIGFRLLLFIKSWKHQSNT
jgi:hypothetical protein